MKKNRRDNRSHIMMRYILVIAVITLFSGAIIAKLTDTTVFSRSEWNKKAMTELSRVDTIIPERGDILAADGSILATNLRYYNLRIDYRSEKFMEDTLRKYIDVIADSMASHFKHHTAKEWHKILMDPIDTKIKEKRPRAYKILSNVSYSDYEFVKSLPFFKHPNRNRNGLTLESVVKRANPYGDMARRSIGRVGQHKNYKGVRGLSGLEMALDSLLRGKVGRYKRVPLTHEIVNWTDVPAERGYDIVTTIDINMQDIVENELNDMLTYCDADWGVAVLMDVATGDIKAISNLEKSEKGDYYTEGINRAVLGFEPGSVVKVLSMLIALEDGIVNNVNEVITTGPGWAYCGGNTITDSHATTSLTVSEVIERSSNIGMARIITRRYGQNPGQFYHRIKQLGFLDPLNTNIAGERRPRIDSVKTDNGGRIAMSRQCYGYATEIPPLYTLALYNAIANGGKFVRPRLVSEMRSETVDTVLPVQYVRERVCSEANAAKLRDMMRRVVEGDHGTGKRLRNDMVPIAGKTGTCYMIDKDTKKYDKSKKRLTFCGYFPADNPRYSCIVLTAAPRRNAMGAASTSGMTLRNIALKLYSRGMLGNTSDYTAQSHPGTRPTLCATGAGDSRSTMRSHLGIESSGVLRGPATRRSGVPDVTGLGLREAIATLENAGYNVTFSGSGHVTSQTPAAGTTGHKGGKVNLTLR